MPIPSEVKKMMICYIRAKRPVFLWGPPGVGKSDVVAQVANHFSVELRDIRAILLDPVDLRGIPVPDNGQTVWFPPGFLPNEGRGIMFFDEINAAPLATQAACYELFLTGTLGAYKKPPGWAIVCAGNREADRAVVNRMPTTLANRMGHIQFEHSQQDFLTWAYTHNIHAWITAYIKWRPDHLLNFNPKDTEEKAFASPRSWEILSDLLHTDPPEEIIYDIVAGIVGQGIGTEFMVFVRMARELIDPQEALRNPETVKIPQKADVLYALTGSIARVVDEDQAEGLTTLANRILKEVDNGGPEFALHLIKTSCEINEEITETPAYQGWIAQNSSLYI